MVREAMSRGDLFLLTATLAVAGIVTSGYLTWEWFEAVSAPWCDIDASFSCTKVRESPFSAVAGIPTSLVGVGGFAILAILALLGLRGVGAIGPWPTTRWLLTFAILGALTGLSLTVVEIFLIRAVCILCAVGFALDLSILGAALRLNRSDEDSRKP